MIKKLCFEMGGTKLAGKLFLVGTPIGNLKDITLRALETLQAVDYIACEDTRHSNILLQHYEINKPTFSVHKFNEKQSCNKVFKLLSEGKNIAYISDAGMPSISDPGYVLMKFVLENNFQVEIISGVTAVTTALVGSGLATEKFTFLGFLPEQKSDKDKELQHYKNLDSTLIFYVSSHNINEDLTSLFEVLGKRNVVVANELTKKFEKYIRGILGELKIEEPKGEYVVLVEGVKPISPLNDLSLEQHLQYYLEQGLSKMDAIKQVASDKKVPKSEIYKLIIKN